MMRGCPPVAVGAGRTDSRRLFPGQPAGSGCDITGRRKTLGPGFLYGKPGERRSAAAVPALPPSLRCGQSRRAAGLGLFPSYSLLLLFLSKSIKCSGGIWGWKAAVPGDEKPSPLKTPWFSHCAEPLSSPWLALPVMALCLKQVFNKDKTFRPRKKFEPGTQRFELYKKAQASLKSGLDLKAVVQLPPGESINDWIAVHVVDFFNRINLIYGTMSEYCTEKSCPIMSGGLKYEYRWQDDSKYKKPTKLSAPQYMCMLMDWIEMLINNEDIFPTRIGIPFPKQFQQVCTKILTRLFRVFVHVYIHHFDSIINMGAEAHVNTCYKHFYYFIKEFSLVDHRELEPLMARVSPHESHDRGDSCLQRCLFPVRDYGRPPSIWREHIWSRTAERNDRTDLPLKQILAGELSWLIRSPTGQGTLWWETSPQGLPLGISTQ
ncbi:MOB kinase activator 3C isoform X2 [Columba livia]|uniref:MOB kinase activator 3C isoform X2 n=1 Tax=Columba livia TaxID=8932 RepID=UPI0031BA9B61